MKRPIREFFLLGWRWGMGEGDGGRGMEKRERRGNLGLGT